MAVSQLKRLINLFEEQDTTLSLGYIAYHLEITPEKAESMLQYWISRGRIVEMSESADCGSCGVNGSCPFVYQLPTSFRLADQI
jgi:hypothetical protein